MAQDLDDFRQELDDLDENKLIELQALITGFLTRKWMYSLRNQFNGICSEIEQKEIVHVWPRETLCLPNWKPRKVKKTNTNLNDEETLLKDGKLSVESQTDFNGINNVNQTPTQTSSDKLSSQQSNLHTQQLEGAGTSSDPVVILDQTLISEKQDLEKQLKSDSIDNVPVRDLSPRQTRSTLPVSERSCVDDIPQNDVTQAADMTSIWDAELSSLQMNNEKTQLPSDKEELKEMRKNLAMELLWIQQAIQSRKNYLKLKDQMV